MRDMKARVNSLFRRRADNGVLVGDRAKRNGSVGAALPTGTCVNSG